MTQTEAQPMFIPAAICTLAAYIPAILFIATLQPAALVATGFLWGASIGLWVANGKRGGIVPWPKSFNEYRQMTSDFYDKK